MAQLTRTQIKKITGCPLCGAMAGNECFQKDGKTRRKANHNERLLLAQEIAGHSVKRGKGQAAKAGVERLISEKGGYSKAALASLGVSWPPPKGWKKALTNGATDPKKKRTKREVGEYSMV